MIGNAPGRRYTVSKGPLRAPEFPVQRRSAAPITD